MKLTALPEVTALATRRQKLQEMADAAELGLIDLRIGSAYPYDSITAVTRPAIIAECRALIAQTDRDLKALGVEVD